MKQFKIIDKKNLTDDVFEIHYESSEKIEMKPGQFVTFILPKIGWRAYSILDIIWNKIILIIKRVKIENWWRWGSIFLCDSKIGDVFKWVWPAGHFVLKESDKNRLFMWTWTWLVPLYNQIISGLSRWDKSKYKLIFWVRKESDLYYVEKFKELSKKYINFSYELFLSREETKLTNLGYITDFLKKEKIKNFEEFYICWMPNMIESAMKKMNDLKIKSENIFFEKY